MTREDFESAKEINIKIEALKLFLDMSLGGNDLSIFKKRRGKDEMRLRVHYRGLTSGEDLIVSERVRIQIENVLLDELILLNEEFTQLGNKAAEHETTRSN